MNEKSIFFFHFLLAVEKLIILLIQRELQIYMMKNKIEYDEKQN